MITEFESWQIESCEKVIAKLILGDQKTSLSHVAGPISDSQCPGTKFKFRTWDGKGRNLASS